MELETITLLSEEEYKQYKSLIPAIYEYWWLKTPNSKYDDCGRIVDLIGFLHDYSCYHDFGVRPFCIFNLDSSEPMFWSKPETLVSSEIEYGAYTWTILNVKNGELHALCNGIVSRHRFDKSTNIWEKSELKAWLETDVKIALRRRHCGT